MAMAGENIHTPATTNEVPTKKATSMPCINRPYLTKPILEELPWVF